MKLIFPPKKAQFIIAISSFCIAFAVHSFMFLLEFGMYNAFGDILIKIIQAMYFVLFFPAKIIIYFLGDELPFALQRFATMEGFLYWVIPSAIWIWFLCNIFWAPYYRIKNKIVFPSVEIQILFLILGAVLGYLSSSYFQTGFFTWLSGNIIWIIGKRIKDKKLGKDSAKLITKMPTFPSEKFQIKLVLVGMISGAFILLLALLFDYLFYDKSVELIGYTVLTLFRWMVIYNLIFWFIGNIVWMALAKVRKPKI